MPMTPPEIEGKLRQHDKDISEIYAKLASIERKTDAVRAQVQTRFDRVESRLGHLGVVTAAADGRLDAVDLHLTGIDAQLGRLDAHLTEFDTHLVGIDRHLAGMDRTLVEVLRRLPDAG